jgi:TRAP-type C4-dicarboxylate transport system permease small subunit
MSDNMSAFMTADLWIWRIFKIIALICTLVLFILLLGNVTVRVFKLGSFGWFDEIVEMSFAYLVFCGSAALCRDSEHFKIDWLEDKLEGTKAVELVLLAVDLITLLFFILFFLSGWKLTTRAKDITPILELPKSLLYGALPAAGAGMLYFSLRNITKRLMSIIRGLKGD